MYNSIDPEVIVDNHDSYNQFLGKMEKEAVRRFGVYEDAVLQFLFKELSNGKRIHELILLEALLESGSICNEQFKRLLARQGLTSDDATLKSVERILNYAFFIDSDKLKYGSRGLVKLGSDECWQLDEAVRMMALEDAEYRAQIQDVVDVARAKYQDYQQNSPLTLFKKYNRKDVCRLLNWEKDEKATLYGYKLKHNTLPIFITYHKSEAHNAHVRYSDELLDPNTILWYTRADRTTNSREIIEIVRSQTESTAVIHVFIKKDDDEGRSYYYLGKARIDQSSIRDEQVEANKGGQLKNIVSMKLNLEHSIELSLYHHLTQMA